MNDADLEMMELAEAGSMAADGVCSICEEALDPLLPKWAASYTSPRYTAVIAAECVGPIHPQLPYHQYCWDEVAA